MARPRGKWNGEQSWHAERRASCYQHLACARCHPLSWHIRERFAKSKREPPKRHIKPGTPLPSRMQCMVSEAP